MLRWVDRLRETVRARDVAMLDEHTPAVLREIWAQMQEENGPLRGSATIYHFGIDERTGLCRRFAYRSADAFVSEEGSAPAFGVKPVPSGSAQPAELTVDGLIAYARIIRDEQDAQPADERIYVGGDLMLTEVRKNVVGTERIYRWGDQYDHWQEIFDELPMGVVARLPRQGCCRLRGVVV